LQKPVVPQLAAPALAQRPPGSAPPVGTGLQVPALAASAHDRQVPVQALSQQTPWAQKPEAHSVPSAQAAPGGLSPHEPLAQTAGGAQSASAVHELLHTETPQRNGKQELEAGVTQAPAPSQVDPGVKLVPVQPASLQGVPRAYF
jgi:hypothetical protein